MTVINYTGNAPTIAQVDTLTPGGTIAIGNDFTVAVGGKSITYRATGTTVASVCTGLHALLAASTYPEFLEITWADSVTAITATAKVPGRPHTIVLSDAQGAGATDTHSFNKTATTVNSGPSDAAAVLNYSSGTLPANSDTLNLDGLAVPILYNCDALAALSGLIVNVTNWSGAFGLPAWNPSGYPEYRPRNFVIPAVAVNYAGSASRAKFDIDNPGAPCLFTITAPSSQSAESNVPAIQIIGGTSTNHIDLKVNKGNVGVAVNAGEVAHIGSFIAGYQTNQTTDAKVKFGPGVVFQDDEYTVLGGQVESNSDVGTITLYPNATVKVAAGEIDTLVDNRGGTFIYSSPETPIGKYIGYSGSKCDLRQKLEPVVFTDVELYANAGFLGGEGILSTTNPIELLGCGLQDVTLPKNKNITLAIANI